MENKRAPTKELTLNEIVEELYNISDDEDIPSQITIFPPLNSNAQVTDEDSGDENQVTLYNLPGTQLRAPASVHYGEDVDVDADTDHDSSLDSDDDALLSFLSKRRRVSVEAGASTSTDPLPAEPSTSLTTAIAKTKTYKWIQRDIRPENIIWKEQTRVNYKNVPSHYFNLFIDDEVITMFVNYTNLYASQKNMQGNINTNEMKCFFGILLYSGYVVVPRRYIYWETGTDCNFQIVDESMSRDRFTFIMSNLHCCDNTNLPTGDKFAKLRPLITLLNKKIVEFAPYNENYSVDEAMVPYYGGHPCKKIIRGKPIRWG